MPSPRPITLTTDFGGQDWFVGTMKGVLLKLAQQTSVVDLTHEIPPGDIRAAAFALAASYSFFPKGTVHVTVIDPGVGSPRAAIAARSSRYLFVGPDNGVLSWALSREQKVVVHKIENPKYFLQNVSSTFHGRDIFAPVAAHLSRGSPLSELGPAMHDYIQLAWPQTFTTDNGVEGEIVYIDRFGNGITNISATELKGLRKAHPSVFMGRKRLCDIALFYQAVPEGRRVAVVGSTGFLEVAVNGGSAAKQLHLRVGLKVSIR